MCPVSVLLVEDDTDVRSALRDVLEAEGCTVYEASNGSEGLALLNAMNPLPDILLLDLMLPGPLNGWDVLCVKQADERLSGIPVVVLTAVTPQEARARSLEGAHLILKKPFSIPQILSVVTRIESTCPDD